MSDRTMSMIEEFLLQVSNAQNSALSEVQNQNRRQGFYPLGIYSLLKIKLNLCEIHQRKAGQGKRNPAYKVLSLFCSWHKLLGMLLIFVPVKVLWRNIVCLRNDSSWDGKQNAVLTEKSTRSRICIWTRVYVSHCLTTP